MIPVYLYTRMKSNITLHWQYNQSLNGQETTSVNSKQRKQYALQALANGVVQSRVQKD